MVNPGIYDLVCPQGATFQKTFTWSVDGTAVNLTGYSAALQVRSAYDSDVALVSLVSGSGIVLGGAAGTIDVTISAAVTSGLPVGSLTYDLELTSGSVVTRLLQGAFNVSGGVTR
jgi:Na+/serine symporter